MSFWDSEVLIASVPKNDKGDEIHIKKVRKGKGEFIDVRTFYFDKKDQTLKPGRGIAIPIDLADEIAEQILQSTREGNQDIQRKTDL